MALAVERESEEQDGCKLKAACYIIRWESTGISQTTLSLGVRDGLSTRLADLSLISLTRFSPHDFTLGPSRFSDIRLYPLLGRGRVHRPCRRRVRSLYAAFAS